MRGLAVRQCQTLAKFGSLSLAARSRAAHSATLVSANDRKKTEVIACVWAQENMSNTTPSLTFGLEWDLPGEAAWDCRTM
eukprot:4908449-Amphidinium_carterae.1